jgi:hypothetical protein
VNSSQIEPRGSKELRLVVRLVVSDDEGGHAVAFLFVLVAMGSITRSLKRNC